MTRRKQRPSFEPNAFPASELEPHQVRAAVSPAISLKQLASGNFHDLDSLLEHLGDPPIFQLGHPLPNERFIPKPRAGSCPAAHNDALVGEPSD
jgi:hypothetical protein